MNPSFQSLSVQVKFFGPTNTRGDRVKVTCPHLGKSKVFSYDWATSRPKEQIEKALYDAGIECQTYIYDEKTGCTLIIEWTQENREALIKFFAAK